jgi:hypothetical protein
VNITWPISKRLVTLSNWQSATVLGGVWAKAGNSQPRRDPSDKTGEPWRAREAEITLLFGRDFEFKQRLDTLEKIILSLVGKADN